MIVVHIESGLGNQMLSYCEYLALKKIHPEDNIYIENLIYDIPAAANVINQWNGYELERIFGISEPNIKGLFSNAEWSQIMKEITDSRFWEKNWNYPPYIVAVLNRHGLSLKNMRGDFEAGNITGELSRSSLCVPDWIKQTGWYAYLRMLYFRFFKKNAVLDDRKMLFYLEKDDIFTGQRLSFKDKGNDISLIDDQIRKAFRFPTITDERNVQFSEKILECESVAIHARRGDMLTVNGRYYKSGYFRRAVKYIKKNVDSPVFFFFCDPGSIEWCKENSRTFGLDYSKDKVFFVDWNRGKESFRDMQLMAMCKHNIITNSSFGWWGAYLNENPDKITISPEIEINTTYHC